MFCNATDAVVVSDEGGRILEFNPAAEQMFGVGRSEVLGCEVSEVLLPDRHRRSHREALRRRATHHPPLQLVRLVETTARRHDDTEFPVELSLASLPVDPPVFVAFMRDLTSRNETESAPERCRRIVEATREIMALAGPDLLAVAGNRAAERALARPPDGTAAGAPDLNALLQPIQS